MTHFKEALAKLLLISAAFAWPLVATPESAHMGVRFVVVSQCSVRVNDALEAKVLCDRATPYRVSVVKSSERDLYQSEISSRIQTSELAAEREILIEY